MRLCGKDNCLRGNQDKCNIVYDILNSKNRNVVHIDAYILPIEIFHCMYIAHTYGNVFMCIFLLHVGVIYNCAIIKGEGTKF